MTTEIYLDSNATSVVLPAAIAAATDAMRHRYGNPSSTHATGLQAKAMLDEARACAVRLLGVGNGRLMFNSGATEGIQTAVLSALVSLRERRDAGEAIGSLLVYGATEHKAVPESLAHWNRLLGLNLTLHKLPVDHDGAHSLPALRELAPQAAMVCTMAANNETGVVSDLAGIAAALEGSKALWLVDCVQALGKLKLDLSSTRIDYAPFSGHKLYAPKGIGMLYVRAGAPFTPLIMGGGQEAGQRSGTENMAGIAALGAVLAALERGDTFRSAAELCGFRARLADSLRGLVQPRAHGCVRCGRSARQRRQRLFLVQSGAELCAGCDGPAAVAQRRRHPHVVWSAGRRGHHCRRLRTHRTLRRGLARQLPDSVRTQRSAAGRFAATGRGGRVQLDGAGCRQPQLHRHRSAAGPCGAYRVVCALPELSGASHCQHLAECRPRHADRCAGPPLQPPGGRR
jgi:cysteine sulfinate desulfinase/cysteine desulfurase-like protein